MPVPTPPTAPSAPPTAPQRTESSTFSARMDAWLTWFVSSFWLWLYDLVPWFQNIANETEGWANSASTSASDAAASAAGIFSGNNTFSGTNAFTQPPTLEGVQTGRGGGGVESNTMYGVSALANNTTGSYDTGVGLGALQSNTTGDNNTAFGGNALQGNTTGNNNTGVGGGALSSVTTFANVSGLGYNAQVTGSNEVQLGDAYTTTYVYGTVQNRSDLRDKSDVRDTTLGLSFIKALRAVDYRWDMRDDYRPPMPAPLSENPTLAQMDAHKKAMDAWRLACKHGNIVRDGSKKRTRYHHGVIAQEVKTVMDTMGVDFGGFQDHEVKGGEAVLSIGYDELIAPLIKSVQELAAQNAALFARITELESKRSLWTLKQATKRKLTLFNPATMPRMNTCGTQGH